MLLYYISILIFENILININNGKAFCLIVLKYVYK